MKMGREKYSNSADLHYMTFVDITQAQRIADRCTRQYPNVIVEMTVIDTRKIKTGSKIWRTGYIASVEFYDNEGIKREPIPYTSMGSLDFDYLFQIKLEKKRKEKAKA